jgi:hAT family protein
MSAEAERVFSGARRTISWERASLSARTIERLECLKNWLKSKLSHGVFLTKEGNITRAEDVELVVKQAERDITESQASKASAE